MRDINTYLTDLAQQIILDPGEKEKIDVSIGHLKTKIWGHFQDKLSQVETFGSYDRGTIVPADNDADVDILIILKERQFQPQTYLNQIKEFCNKNYPRSEVFPDHPTVVVQLDHIKIELVPSLTHSNGIVKIPAPRSNELKWLESSPQAFKTKLLVKDKNNKALIIPLVRIFKYWNTLQGKVFSSFELEKYIVNKEYFNSTMRSYYFDIVSSLGDLVKTEEQRKCITALKERSRRLKVLENEKIPEYIESEFMSFLPLLK